MIRVLLLLCALFVSSSFLWLTNSFACSCAILPTPEEALARSYAVFSGKAMKIEEPPQAIEHSSAPVTITFAVKETWKGNVDRMATVKTARSTASCGYAFLEGAEYLVYAAGDDSLTRVSLCSRTALLAEAEQDLQSLGSGTINSEYGQWEMEDRETKISALWWITGLIVVIIAVAWIGIQKSKRS